VGSGLTVGGKEKVDRRKEFLGRGPKKIVRGSDQFELSLILSWD